MKSTVRRSLLFAVLGSLPTIVYLAVIYRFRFFFRDTTATLRNPATPKATKDRLIHSLQARINTGNMAGNVLREYFPAAILVMAPCALIFLIVRSLKAKSLRFPAELLGLSLSLPLSMLLSLLMEKLTLWGASGIEPSRGVLEVISENRLPLIILLALPVVLCVGYWLSRQGTVGSQARSK